MSKEKFSLREWSRAASVGCSGQVEETALAALESGDLTTFSDLLSERDGERGAAAWLNTGTGPGGPLLERACQTPGRQQYVSLLLSAGARADLVGAASGLAPLHLAAQAGDPALLSLLLTDSGADCNVRAADRKGGWGPLHFAAQGGREGHLACLAALLEREEVSVDLRDIRAVQTPLALAVQHGDQAAARLLLAHGADPDLKCGRKTVREYMAEEMAGLEPSAVRVVRRKEPMEDLEDRLLTLVRETQRHSPTYSAELGAFRALVRLVKEGGQDRELGEVLGLAAEKGLEEHVALLLRRGAGPNGRQPAVLEAAGRGRAAVLEVLLQDPRTLVGVARENTGETLLHLVLKMEDRQVEAADYRACLALLLQGDARKEMEALVNRRDSLDNTALHYATQRWPEEAVTALLELGANIGIKNYLREIPISRIRPETMEDFLDSHCLSTQGDVMHQEFSVQFNYSFLAPDKEALPDRFRPKGAGGRRLLGEEQEEEEEEDQEQSALPETESLWYMGQSREHRHLLRHPVITSFLWFKWQRIRKYFNRNLRLYLLTVALLTWYVFREYGGHSQRHQLGAVCYSLFCLLTAGTVLHMGRDLVLEAGQPATRLPSLLLSSLPELSLAALMLLILIFGAVPETEKSEEQGAVFHNLLRGTIIFLLCILGLVEIFQLAVSLKRYVLSVENWLEVTMIVSVSVLLANEGGDLRTLRLLAGLAILLSWAKLITLIGKHPKHNRLNIYVTMFFKVLTSFFYFLLWYGLFIMAYGLSFYIMLHNDLKPQNTSSEEKVDEKKEEEYAFFNTTFLSVVKTLTMFVGELEFSDIPIDLESSLYPLNYLFFLSFVFLIVVVLMNLLNGLAVGDTREIQEQAEIYSHLSRVETISYLESVLLGDPFDFLSNVPSLLAWLRPCSILRQVYRSRRMRSLLLHLGAGNILLFYNFLHDKQSAKIFPNQRPQGCGHWRWEDMDMDTVRAVKTIVSRRREGRQEGVEGRLGQLEQQVAALKSALEGKLDLLLAKR